MSWIIVDQASNGQPSGTAMKRLLSALEAKNIPYERRVSWSGALPKKILIAAVTTAAAVYNLLSCVPTAPESILLGTIKGAKIVSGSDQRGLAYALMEMAERVEEQGEAAMLNLKYECVRPTSAIRGIDRLILNTGDCDWWMNESYWRYYLEDMLAARYNRLVLLVGFDTPYLSPPYPYFVEVPGFPGVHPTDETIDRSNHLSALRRLGHLAHEYGMEFVFATWQQTSWISVQGNSVEGIGDLSSYCPTGLKELILRCPEIDTVQLRVNHESGIGTQITAEEFWMRMIDALYEAKQQGREVALDLRAKGLTDTMIAYAKERCLDLTVSTKYWCEQAGLPYHMTKMRAEEEAQPHNLNSSRRYSYADMLRKPRLHRFIYRLWNDGSTNLFTWGDPDYVRRFTKSLALGRADGFEIMPMLSLKGGPQDSKYTGWSIFDNPSCRPYGFEDSRYWLFRRLFGRIGYNQEESSEAWMRPMRMVFGSAAEAMMDGISAASRIVPLIVAFHFPVHPQEYYWAELSTGGAMFPEHNHTQALLDAGVTYQESMPSDEGLFYSVSQYVNLSNQKKEDGRYTPWQTAVWLKNLADSVEMQIKTAKGIGLPNSPDSKAALLDMSMLKELALYHRERIAAAVAYCKYLDSNNHEELCRCIGGMKHALKHWAALADLGTGTYHSHLVFSAGYGDHRRGHWNDFLPELKADIRRLEKMCAKTQSASTVVNFPSAPALAPCWVDNVPKTWLASKAMPIELKTGAADIQSSGVNLRWRRANQLEGAFKAIPMQRSGGVWRAVIPHDELTGEWDILLYFEATAPDGSGLIYPGIWHCEHAMPYHIVEIE